MSQKPSIPKGTRDFGPIKMSQRNYIFNIIKSVFEKYSFMPLETPTLENLSVLTGKYGDEGDQLLYKILNSGDFLAKTKAEDFAKGSKHLTTKISEKGLRYDLTVPFARYVVMNQNDIAFPFKRYQIQPVWRADRPQKGRYREFYQCDADVVGTDSLLCEAEIIMMIQEVFDKLQISDYEIKINHRQILNGIVQHLGSTIDPSYFYVAIDKLDKIGMDKVLDELRVKGFSQNILDQLVPILSQKGSIRENIEFTEGLLTNNNIGNKGVEEINEISSILENIGGSTSSLSLDLTLARGLSYYTGTIFEVKVNGVSIGSVGGGGRYDNLTEVFGLKGMSGVGFSFGVDRLYDVMDQLGILYNESVISSYVLIANFGKELINAQLNLLGKLRKNNVKAEMYPDPVKLKKQMTYANKKHIPYVILMGSEEIEQNLFTLKNMNTGSQESLKYNELLDKLYLIEQYW